MVTWSLIVLLGFIALAVVGEAYSVRRDRKRRFRRNMNYYT